MRPETHLASGRAWNAEVLPLLSWSAQMLRSPGMCDAITDHLCLWAQAATSCTKTCKGQAVVNNLLTPTSEAVLSVSAGMQMPRAPCPSQDHAIRMSASWAKGHAKVIGGTAVLHRALARMLMARNAIRAASSDCCSERGGDALPEPTWARIFGMSFCSSSQCSQARATIVSGWFG